ncbi:acyl-CoA thioesterase [Aeoliella mucimassa]|uniref:1,4-dihydroxy-2-naphthoyl-CoA hydrolase n=1 Tax=Aeoliella mucimassa TaxID=2527972 RepID=A0A518AL68_9BACT|nr:thioesterase family protein [Aeoliella mucimassa]QDU55467.1 1,4-dihydroxy-2-naphthoyl-CoA hydrolase [Aeoliella mucimassa]
MPQSFTRQRMVEFADTDMAGIMHFASFFHYMESVEHEFFRSLGLSVYTQIEGKAISFPRVAAKCDFKSPAKCEDVLDANFKILRLGRTSLTYQIDFSCEGRPVATGEITCVCCHIFHDRPPESTPLPADFVKLIEPFVAAD